MTPHDDAPAERDELREKLRHLTRDPGPLRSAVCALLNMDDDELYVELASDEVGAILALLAPREAREPGPPMRRVRAPKRRICRDCGDTINTGESALRVGDDEVFHVGYQCGCAEKREAARPAAETEREGLTLYRNLPPREAHDAFIDRLADAYWLLIVEDARKRDGQDDMPAYRCYAEDAEHPYEEPLPLNEQDNADELLAWLRWRMRHLLNLAELDAPAPAEATEREPELLGYVVERQRTPGEWVRVWTGRTLWFDHAEAVLERDAYALDGIPARIRGVYLGAPAPAEARQVLALDAIRDVLGIDYDEDSAMWHLPAEPAPIECATLDDALRAYAKMAVPASGEPSGAAPLLPTHGKHGGPLVQIVAEYEDGTRTTVSPESCAALTLSEGCTPAASGSGAEAVVRDRLAKQAHDALALLVGDIANSDDWREEPRPHAQIVLDWLHKLGRIKVPTAPGAPEEGAE